MRILKGGERRRAHHRAQGLNAGISHFAYTGRSTSLSPGGAALTACFPPCPPPTQVRVNVAGAERDERPIDEVADFVEGRYICASEAAWRLFKFAMSGMLPPVYRLPVHLPGEQTTSFEDNEVLEEIEERGPPVTELVAFFELNRRFRPPAAGAPPLPEDAPQPWLWKYHEVPRHFTWHAGNKEWLPRRRGLDSPFVMIGRMYNVQPSQGERFFLRLLLTRVTGAGSYEELRTVGGVVLPTFKAAAVAHQLTLDDAHVFEAMQDGALFQMPVQLRQMFALFLFGGDCTEPARVWERFADDMSEDFVHAAFRRSGLSAAAGDELQPAVVEDCRQAALRHIDQVLRQQGKSLADFPDLPAPPPEPEVDAVLRELQLWDVAELRQRVAEEEPLLYPAQRLIRDAVMRAVRAPSVRAPIHRLFFIDAPGGYGKTFALNHLLALVRSLGLVAVGAASAGVAGLLLDGGSTAHSRFGIPAKDLDSTSVSSISKQTRDAQVLRAAALIVIDEMPMMHKDGFDVIDRLLRDITGVDLPFGGKAAVFAGDFRQCLPVVPRGSRAAIVNASIRRHALWLNMEKVRLDENMRVARVLRQLGPNY